MINEWRWDFNPRNAGRATIEARNPGRDVGDVDPPVIVLMGKSSNEMDLPLPCLITGGFNGYPLVI